MIVNKTNEGWEIIYQPAHALLAAQLGGRWGSVRPIRWWGTLVAVAEHDNGWHEWEKAAKITDQGAPCNFTQMSIADAIAQWQRGIARGRHISRWVALLISSHATYLNKPQQDKWVELERFIVEQEVLQGGWMEALGVSEEEVKQAYTMIRWTDWLSLILCWRRLPDDGQPVQVGEGPDGQHYQAMRGADKDVPRHEGTVTLQPWPFDEERFTVTVEARYLSQYKFDNDAALRKALEEAPIIGKSWEFQQS